MSLISFLKRIQDPAIIFGGLFLIHYGWQKLQYSPVVNQGEEPTVLLNKLEKHFFGKFKGTEEK